MVLDMFELALVLGQRVVLEVVDLVLVGAETPLKFNQDKHVDFPRATGSLEVVCSTAGSGECMILLACRVLHEGWLVLGWIVF